MGRPTSLSGTAAERPGRAGRALVAAAAAAVAAGIGLRIFFMLAGSINSDEAIVGLMGMEILKGNHFTFYWGQSYMGSLEAYAAALLFALSGASVFALKAVPGIFFLTAAWFHCRFTARVLGSRAALLAAVFLFLAPPVFTLWTIAPRGGYMETLAFGGAALHLGALIRERRTGRAPLVLLLGLISGVALWTHFLYVYYLPALALAVFLPGLASRRGLREATLFGAGALAGFGPVLVYNLKNSFASLSILGMAPEAGLGEKLFNLGVRQAPLLGANKPVVESGSLWPPLSWLLLALYLAAFLYYPLAARRRARLTGTATAVVLMPWVVMLTALMIYLGTRFGAVHTQRYLLPVYPLMVIFLGVLLEDLGRERKRLGVACAVFVLALNGFVTWHHAATVYLPKSREAMVSWQRVVDFCRAEGIRTAWAGHWNCYVLTFLSGQELVVGDLDRDRYEPFQKAAREDPRPSLVLEAYRAEVASTLSAVGYRYRRGDFGRYVVFGRLELSEAVGPVAGRRETRILADEALFEPLGRHGSISRGKQRRGMGVTLLLDEPIEVNGLILSPGPERRDYPRSFTVEASADGLTWEVVATADPYVGGIYHLDRFRHEGNGWVSVYFPPRRLGQLRVTLSKRNAGRRWAIDRAWVATAAAAAPRD